MEETLKYSLRHDLISFAENDTIFMTSFSAPRTNEKNIRMDIK